MVCEANSDAGSGTQGCRLSNAGNGIETRIKESGQGPLHSCCRLSNAGNGIET